MKTNYFIRNYYYNEVKSQFNVNPRICIKRANTYFEKYGNDTSVLFFRAISYRQIGKYDLMLNDLKLICFLDENNIKALVELFFAYYRLRKFNKVRILFHKIIEMKKPLSENYSIDSFFRTNELIKSLYDNSFDNNINRVLNRIANHTEKTGTATIRCTIDGVTHIVSDDRDDDYIFDSDDIEDIDSAKSISEAFDYLESNVKSSKCPIVSVPDEIVRAYPSKNHYFYENIDFNYLYNCVKQSLKTAKESMESSPYFVYYFEVFNIGYSDQEVFNGISVLTIPRIGKNGVIEQEIYDIFPTYIKDSKCNILDCDYQLLRSRKQKSYKV